MPRAPPHRYGNARILTRPRPPVRPLRRPSQRHHYCRASMEHAPTWLTYGFLYLTAAVLAVPIAKALGLGAIIGYLAAGIAIGPWGLGLVSNVQDILHFAEFGVVLMLFLVGLELQPSRLWALRRPIFGTCTAQAGFSILLFQDVAAIPILALLPVLGAAAGEGAGHSPGEMVLEVLKIVGVIAAIILGGRLLLRPVLRWIAKSNTPEIFTAAALLLVVGIAYLMVLVGLSMALGAFLAGVLLADSEYRRELEADIEPFKGLLLGLFFIAVGMSIDFGVILRSPGLMAAILVGFLAAKAVVIYTLAKIVGIPYQERPVFTPLLLVLLDRVLLRRYAQLKNTTPQAEEISEPQEAPIIIAGFGRYGQIVSRVLLAQGIPTTVLDHSVDMLEVARTFGYRVFYGDATRL